MTYEQLEKIFENESHVPWNGDKALDGLNIIAKYFPNETVLVGAEHDVISSVDGEKLAEKITVEDAEELQRLNWMLSEGYLECFV